MRTNLKPADYRVDKDVRLAGGYGPYVAKQDAEAALQRSVMANLLWEDLFYEDGISVVDNIRSLIPQVVPEKVAAIAVEARTKQKLRHVPLLIAREMARLPEHKRLVSNLLPAIILRADELTEFVSLYWQEKRQPLSAQVKKGLARAFTRFNAYHLAKYDRNTTTKLRDVLFLCHAKPKDQEQAEIWKKLVAKELPTPDTWEVSLSAGKDKAETWARLIQEKKIGALAFLRNLRNMEDVKVADAIILEGFKNINPGWLLPLNYLAAAKAASRWEKELETLMLRGLGDMPKLPGYTIFVMDVSGSMDALVSAKSTLSRLEAGAAMAMLAGELCEKVSIYATAGNDMARIHATAQLKPRRGFSLIDQIIESKKHLGGGGIFTRQCLEAIQANEKGNPDRIIVFSDSQDCDRPGSKIPNPFGARNYIVDVSAHRHGINYKGLWTSEIAGWSEHFLSFIAAFEGVNISQENQS